MVVDLLNLVLGFDYFFEEALAELDGLNWSELVGASEILFFFIFDGFSSCCLVFDDLDEQNAADW